MTMTAQAPAAPEQSGAGQLSFLEGTYEYSEPMAAYAATTLGASSVQMTPLNITPGGFLRGVWLNVTSTGGSLGSSGSLNNDNPWNVIQSISMEAIDGTPILYPMGGYAYYLVSKYTRPWDGDPANDSNYSASANPAFNMRFYNESRLTIATLPNTDARAQYRLQLTLNSSGGYFSVAPPAITGSLPSVTVTPAVDIYAQPPQTDYNNVPIAQMPPGIVLQRQVSHQTFTGLGGGDMTFQSTRVGNLVRTLILVFRASGTVANRTNLTGDPIRWRLDNTQLLVESRAKRNYENGRYAHRGDLNSDPVPTGVYVYQRWHDPGRMDGPFWLETTPQTFLQFECQDPSNSLSSGSLEIITEDLAVAGAVPQYLEGL